MQINFVLSASTLPQFWKWLIYLFIYLSIYQSVWAIITSCKLLMENNDSWGLNNQRRKISLREKMHFLDFSKKTKQGLHLINCSILCNVCDLDYMRSGLLSPCSHFYRKWWLQERVLKRRSTMTAAVQCKQRVFRQTKKKAWLLIDHHQSFLYFQDGGSRR